MKIQNHTLIEIEKHDIVDGSCTIPSGITSIGNHAFFECGNLKSITIPEGVTSIGDAAFGLCMSLKSITLPDSITYIGNSAFAICLNLESITIPEGITSIESCAFKWCESLESITLPDSLTSIGDHALERCKALKSILLPDNLTSIGDGAFNYCESLESITLPDGLTSIGKDAFYGCQNLESVILPDSLTSIGKCAFDSCWKLTQIQWGKVSYPVKCMDGSCMYLLQTKELKNYTMYRCHDFPERNNTVWVAKKRGITAYGASVKAAIRNVDIKLLENRDISEDIDRVKSQGYVTPLDYILITGVCEEGTDEFLKLNHLSWNDKRTIQEVIELTEGEYGHETFIKALKDSGCIS